MQYRNLIIATVACVPEGVGGIDAEGDKTQANVGSHAAGGIVFVFSEAQVAPCNDMQTLAYGTLRGSADAQSLILQGICTATLQGFGSKALRQSTMVRHRVAAEKRTIQAIHDVNVEWQVVNHHVKAACPSFIYMLAQLIYMRVAKHASLVNEMQVAMPRSPT